MIKNIIVLSRQKIEEIVHHNTSSINEPGALISIYGSFRFLDFDVMKKLEILNCKYSIDLKFQDYTDKDQETIKKIDPKRKVHLFNVEQAQQIIFFLNKVNVEDISTLIIHCAQGISRSGAVGLFACRYLNLDENQFRLQNRITPNLYILNILTEESGINKDYIQFWENELNKKFRSMISSQIKSTD